MAQIQRIIGQRLCSAAAHTNSNAFGHRPHSGNLGRDKGRWQARRLAGFSGVPERAKDMRRRCPFQPSSAGAAPAPYRSSPVRVT